MNSLWLQRWLLHRVLVKLNCFCFVFAFIFAVIRHITDNGNSQLIPLRFNLDFLASPVDTKRFQSIWNRQFSKRETKYWTLFFALLCRLVADSDYWEVLYLIQFTSNEVQADLFRSRFIVLHFHLVIFCFVWI